MDAFVLKNAMIIDCTGEPPLEFGSVVIEGDRIKEVSENPDPSGHRAGRVIDCKGKTLLPGLIDAHVHMGSIDSTFTEQQRKNYTSTLVIRTLAVMRETLAQGFTTVRDAGGADPGYRVAVETGEIDGPRMSVSGRMLSQTGGHGDGRLPTEFYTPWEHYAGLASGVYDGVDAVRKASREQLRQGVDFLKVMAGGGAMSPADELDTAQYSLDELKAIVFEAENAGKYVAAHCYSDRSIRHCLCSGVRTIEHGNLMSREVAEEIAAAGAYLVPTLVTYEEISKNGAKFGVERHNIRKIEQALEKAYQALTYAVEAGVRIGSGSDLLGPMQVNKGKEIELQAKVMGNMGALMATTMTNAEIIGREKDLGSIEAGKLADLILVDGNPLEDPAVFQDYHNNITFIMQGGKVKKNLMK